MKRPEMILFDYGHTLLGEPGFDARRCEEAAFPYIEYVIRKPDRMLFETALRKADLGPEQVWYCGDSMEADVIGAHGAGIYPVLYEGSAPNDVSPFARQNDGVEAAFDYLHIYDWDELITVLEES